MIFVAAVSYVHACTVNLWDRGVEESEIDRKNGSSLSFFSKRVWGSGVGLSFFVK